MNCDLIIKGKYVLPMNEKMSVIEDGAVVVVDNIIKEVGLSKDIEQKFVVKKVIDVGFGIVMPGMINTHTHSAMAYFRGLADDLPLHDWLEKHIWPTEAEYIQSEFVKESTELACLEMIRAGVTCFNDMYFFEEETGEMAEKAGMRAVLGETVLDFPTPSAKEANETFDKTFFQLDKFKNSDLVKIALAPHAIYTCGQKSLERVKKEAEERKLLIHIHISETKKEVDDCIEKNGMSPVEYLDKIGLLTERTIAAHSVWLSDKDLDIYEERGVKVSHCPLSNMKLASGVTVLPKMIEKGIVVGLGTDSVASNNTLDLFSDMRACAMIHKVNNLEPTLVSAKEVVRMATIDGAKVLGLDKEIGSLEAGKKADIITIDLNKPHLVPIHNPYSHLVYCVGSEDVNDVIVDGKVLMRDRGVKTINEKEVLQKAKEFQIK